MSFRFDDAEAPQFRPDATGEPCVACHEYESAGRVDRDTGLCRPCWRVVVLGPAMANQD